MELRHLRYVLAAAEAGSFRAAAHVLDIRESAIGRRIRYLEDEIGAALFIRSHQVVKLTYCQDTDPSVDETDNYVSAGTL